MYREYFGLIRDPFAMTPDPRMLHMTVAQREALAGINYAILARRGFVALIGDAGTGKTTLLNKLMRTLEKTRARFSVVFNPTLTTSEFLESVLADFGVTAIPESKTQRLLVLHKLLLETEGRRVLSVLIVDEAHKLSPEVLEEIRLLSNFERPEGKLLQIVLAGQPQLAGILDRSDLEQLKQRIAVRLRIGRFSESELQAYVAHRWVDAGGGTPTPFGTGAVRLLAACSKGIPRVVNSLCDNALMLAMADGVKEVSSRHVEEAARDLAFGAAPASAPAVRPAPEGVAVAKAAAAAKVEARPAAPPVVKPAVVAPPEPEPISIPTLERYAPEKERPSVMARLLGKLGLAD